MTRYLAGILVVAAIAATAALTPRSLSAQEPQPAAQRMPQDTLQPRTAPIGARMDSTTAGGRFVVLADGTRWEIHPQDRPAADAWQVGDFVVVRFNPAASGDPIRGYNVVLVNAAVSGEIGRGVLARFAGR